MIDNHLSHRIFKNNNIPKLDTKLVVVCIMSHLNDYATKFYWLLFAKIFKESTLDDF